MRKTVCTRRKRESKKILKNFESREKARVYWVKRWLDRECPRGWDMGCPRGKRGKKGKLPDTTLLGKVPWMTENQWNQAKALYLSGKTWKAIGNELRLNFATLTSKASKEGITKVRRELRNTVSHKETVSLESLSALVRSKLAADAASTLERVESYALDGIKDESVRETILASVAKRSALTFGWSETGEAPSVSVNILGALPDRVEVGVTPETK